MRFFRKGGQLAAGEAGDSGLASYYKDADTWENTINRQNSHSRALAWTVAAMTSVVAVASLGALVLLLPLKTYEPYMVEVDRNSGFVEVKRALQPGALKENEAVTMANVVRYIRARETYDAHNLKADFNLAQVLSTGKASDELVKIYSPNNPDNPTKIFGRRGSIAVNVKALSFPNNQSALVRFSTMEDSGTKILTRHWQALVRFRYTSSPASNELRFDNPLGFQVTEYRKDQESVRADARESTAEDEGILLEPSAPLTPIAPESPVDAGSQPAQGLPAPVSGPKGDAGLVQNPPPPPFPGAQQ